MKVLLVGASGLLGGACRRHFEAVGIEFDCPSSLELDITNEHQIELWLQRGYAWCVNCAAFALFNLCERQPERAMAVNGHGPFLLARACDKKRVRLVHFSSDFVFDGQKDSPYIELDKPNPMSVYGRTKLYGERAVAEASSDAITLRTSWLYGTDGACFVRNIVEQIRARGPIRVVADQFGTPTSTDSLAKLVIEIFGTSLEAGLYHAAGSEVMSWHQLASMVINFDSGMTQVHPIWPEPLRTADWPASAIRPAYSALSSKKLYAQGIQQLDDNLFECVSAINEALSSTSCLTASGHNSREPANQNSSTG